MDDPFDLPPDVLSRVPLFAELSKVLSWTGGPVNWDLARQVAVSVAAAESLQPPMGGADHEEAADHARIAELWLNEVASLPGASHLVKSRAGNAADWADHATEAYRELIDPIAAKGSRALSEQQADGAQAMLTQALGQIVPVFMGIQVGTTIGSLAREVTGDADVLLPAAESDLVLLFPAIDVVAEEYHLDRTHARQWVALREMARRLTLEGFPWVRARFFSLYHDYVASLDIDLASGIERLQQLDLSDPSRLQDALADEGLFATEPSPQTAASATRVVSLLGLIDAYGSIACETAATARAGIPTGVAEAFRRRALSQGPGARMFEQFIGLEQSADRKLATAFVRGVLDRGGWPAVNRMWEDPETLPEEAELSDLDSWFRRTGS